MSQLKHGSLFSGIGGFDLAAEWVGWENKFHCEWNQFGKRVLQHYWPKAKSYEDITKTDFTIYRGKVDVLSGGFPCQPFSVAGKRNGQEDDRYLWPEMLRAVNEIRPTWVVGENVTGLITMVQPGEITKVEGQASLFEEDYTVLEYEQDFVIETICRDLERIGYQVYPIVIPACSVGAPHKRDRVWFIAHSKSEQSEWLQSEQRETSDKKQRESRGSCGRMGNRIDTNTCSEGLQGSEIEGSIGESKQDRNKQDRNKQSTRLLQPKWEKFPTQSPIRNGDDGISSRLDGITFSNWRTESIKGGGNAIVPQVAFEIFKFIKELS